MLDLTKTERKRRSRRLALFNSYREYVKGASEATVAAARRWYARAHQACGWIAHNSEHSLSEVAAATAALSPGTAWSKNIVATWAFACRRDRQLAKSYHSYGYKNYLKAIRCLQGDAPIGEHIEHDSALGGHEALKVKMFYRSIMLQGGAVCDDRWIYRVNRLGYAASSPEKGHHRACWSAMRMLASKLDMKSYQAQALVWLRSRERAEDADVEYDPMRAIRNVPLELSA